jgi:hypothetical protein
MQEKVQGATLCFGGLRHKPSSHPSMPTIRWGGKDGFDFWGDYVPNKLIRLDEFVLGPRTISRKSPGTTRKTNARTEFEGQDRIDPVLNRAQVTLMMDGGWDQRASGKAYNRPVVSVGAQTNKVCYLVYYSKRCNKCEKGWVHSCDLCTNPEKYDRSSKAMDSLGSIKTILSIWKKYPKAYVKCILTNEDTTTRSKLR